MIMMVIIIIIIIVIVMKLKRNIGNFRPNATACRDFIFLGHFQITLKYASLVNILKIRIPVVLTIYDRNCTH